MMGAGTEHDGDASEIREAAMPAEVVVNPPPRSTRSLTPWLVIAIVWAVVASVVAVFSFMARADSGDRVNQLQEELAGEQGRLEAMEEQVDDAEQELSRASADLQQCRRASGTSRQALGLWQDFLKASSEGQGFRSLRAFIRLQDFRREWGRTATACLGEGAETFSAG